MEATIDTIEPKNVKNRIQYDLCNWGSSKWRTCNKRNSFRSTKMIVKKIIEKSKMFHLSNKWNICPALNVDVRVYRIS